MAALPVRTGSVTAFGEHTRGVQNDAIQPCGTPVARRRTDEPAGAVTRTANDFTVGSAAGWHVPATSAHERIANPRAMDPMLRPQGRHGNKRAYTRGGAGVGGEPRSR